jgi:hypothetical protein
LDRAIDRLEGREYRKATLLRRRHILVVVGFVFALALMLWARGSSRDDPRVAGRRLSAWFRDITRDERAWALGKPNQGPVVGMAVDVFLSQGTNAVVLLVGELKRSTEDSALGEFLDGINNELPKAFRLPWVERRTRKEVVRMLLEQLDLRLADLLPALEPLLKSPDTFVKTAAIQSLGCVRLDQAEAAIELRKHAGSTNALQSRAAIKALTSLGTAATNALEEILLFAAKVAPHPDVDAVLRVCGPAAEAALPMLEESWKAGTDKAGRLNLAITLCCVRPGHPEAWAFLESIARGQGNLGVSGDPSMDLVRAVGNVGVGTRQFTPLLLEIAKRHRKGGGSTVLAVVDALIRIDPAAADPFLQELMTFFQETDPSSWTTYAGMLMWHQPTNAFVRELMLRHAMAEEKTSLPVFAILGLAASPNTPDEVRLKLEGMVANEEQYPQFRDPLVGSLKWVRLREELKSVTADREK